MGFLFEPGRKSEAQDFLQQLMSEAKRELRHSLPFAMEPVVYDFAINDHGSIATMVRGDEALLPARYYAMVAPTWVRLDIQRLSPAQRAEIERVASECRAEGRLAGATDLLLSSLLPRPEREESGDSTLLEVLDENGFDPVLHERIRLDLRPGRIGLAQNRLPATTVIEDVRTGDTTAAHQAIDQRCRELGQGALADGQVAVLTLAAGAGSRWTQGAGVVKALHPFHRFQGRHRSFLEVHLAKSRARSLAAGTEIPHVVTTSYLTHGPIEQQLNQTEHFGYCGPVYLSRGRSIGLRMIPMSRDLRFAWEEMPQQMLDEQAQKVRHSLQNALIAWAENAGCGEDYTDNLPRQCLHPVGHWFEVANLLLNGTLGRLLADRPQLRYLMLHNIDTLGADVDPGVLGLHIQNQAGLTFEVIGRRIEDRGGGLARVDGKPRLLESLAMTSEEDEFKLTYYNTMTTWISVDRLLSVFGVDRTGLHDPHAVATAVRQLSLRMPTYITIKSVKKRWGNGQEDVFPVSQFEKLWSDMTSLSELDCHYVVVSRMRGQQLKEPSQLDGWLRDGSAEHVDRLCHWPK